MASVIPSIFIVHPSKEYGCITVKNPLSAHENLSSADPFMNFM